MISDYYFCFKFSKDIIIMIIVTYFDSPNVNKRRLYVQTKNDSPTNNKENSP